MSEDDFVESCGNVFADMGLEDAEALLDQAQHALKDQGGRG